MSLQLLKLAGLCFAVLALGIPLSAQAQHTHELEKNFCILKVGPYGMHLTGYQPDLAGGKENCGEVPGTGRTVLVLDYIEGELRSLPVEVRVIKDTGSEQDLQAITVLHVPPKVFPLRERVDWARLQPAHLTLDEREQLISQAIRMKRTIRFHDQAGLVDCLDE